MFDLKNQLIIQTMVFLMMDIVQLATPFVMAKLNNFKHRNDIDFQDKHHYESLHMNKDSLDSIIPDYLTIMLSLAMCLTFGSAWPMCVFVVFLSNHLAIRVDLVR